MIVLRQDSGRHWAGNVEITNPAVCTIPTITRLLLATDGRCWYCGDHLKGETATKDHVRALARGGRTGACNMVVACKPCNQRKASYPLAYVRLMLEFPQNRTVYLLGRSLDALWLKHRGEGFHESEVINSVARRLKPLGWLFWGERSGIPIGPSPYDRVRRMPSGEWALREPNKPGRAGSRAIKSLRLLPPAQPASNAVRQA